MTQPTIQQKLTAIVQAGIGGGALSKDHYKNNINGKEIQWDDYAGYLDARLLTERPDIIHLPDLINDNAFMRAIFGDGEGCYQFICSAQEGLKENEPCLCERLQTCVSMIPRHHYIQQQAIIIEDADEQIKYLYERIGR